MTDVALVCEEHDPLDGSVHGLLMCSKDVFDRSSAERLAGNVQVSGRYLSLHILITVHVYALKVGRWFAVGQMQRLKISES